MWNSIMKQILTIKQKCRECDGDGYLFELIKGARVTRNKDCPSCKGTGQQETKLYSLKDFEKCDCECHSLDSIKLIGKWENHFEYVDNEFAFGKCCYKTNGYKIPKEYEPYEKIGRAS